MEDFERPRSGEGDPGVQPHPGGRMGEVGRRVLSLRAGAVALLALLPAAARAGVVINEVFYHAPDDLDDLQWIELHNAADERVDLGGWVLDKGVGYTFPAGAVMEARGYLVLARNLERFREFYDGVAVVGPFERSLGNAGDRLLLLDARGERVDELRYRDRAPWPASADGASASLERISPGAPGELPENWAASPLPEGPARPAGTPGKENASFSAVLPPVIASVAGTPDDPKPGEPLRVEAEVKDGGGLREVTLLHRAIARGVEGKEEAVPMGRDPASGRYVASIPGLTAGTLLRYRVRSVNEAGARRFYPAENDLRPTLSAYVHDPWEPAKLPFGLIIHVREKPGEEPPPAARGRRRGGGPGLGFFGFGSGGRGSRQPRPPRGSDAFVHVDHKTGKTAVFDHLHAVQRAGARGYKIHFPADLTFNGNTVLSLVFEGSERFLLAEALAYDVYRRAGNAAPLADFIRLWVDGELLGYHLTVEQPNRSFLRRNQIRDDGNLYKLIWYGQGVVGQHQKRTNVHSGHDDLLAIVEALEKTQGDDQWRAIQESFNVRQVATYFAVNMVLSHWDGFFNNYFTYHDAGGTNRWEIYPWDQDKTWGYHDGLRDGGVFFDLPLTFGMTGDRPPGAREGRSGRGGGFNPFGGGPFGGGTAWWRPAGHFSGPLLANPQFRKVFLARTREVLETVYTPEVYFPLIDAMAERLKDDVVLLARLNGDDPESGTRLLERNVASLRTHILKRREFLLAQDELRR